MVGVPNGTSGLTTWDRFIYHTYEMECTCNAMDALEWIHRNAWNDGMDGMHRIQCMYAMQWMHRPGAPSLGVARGAPPPSASSI